MTEHEASRTLVKSPPELWAECSEAGSLARHLGEFGEIRITRLEPETAVAWEGESTSGTVRIEPSAWGTRVTLTAQVEAGESQPAEPEPVPEPVAQPVPEPVAQPDPEPVAVADPEPGPEPQPAQVATRGGLLKRMRALFKPERAAVAPPRVPEPVAEVPPPEPEPEPDPEPAPEREPVPEPAALEPEPITSEPELDAEKILVAALDSLGRAHHRPFSRA